jgi:hypothetical protein
MVQPTSNIQLSPCGVLKGHKGWVTCISTPSDPSKNFIVSGSRGKLNFPLFKWMDILFEDF